MTAAAGRVAPIQIRAQFLRDMEAPAFAGDGLGPVPGMVAMPDVTANTTFAAAPARRGHWREKDLQRAISAAKRSGLSEYRVEIAPDGTIAIVVGHAMPKRGTRRHS